MLMGAVAVIGFLATISVQPAHSASARASRAPVPQMVVHASRGIPGEPVPLGLTMQGATESAIVIVTGLIPGMSLSSGSAAGADSWQVPAKDLPNTWVGPPVDFVGAVDLVAELRLDGATVSDRQTIRIEWGATNPAVAAQAAPTQVATTPPEPEAAPAPPPPPQLPEAVPTPPPPPPQLSEAVPMPPLPPQLSEAVPTPPPPPPQLDHAEVKVEEPSERIRQKRVASKAAVPAREKKPVTASAPRRAPDAPALPDRPQDTPPPSQPAETRDDQASARTSNEGSGILGLFLPRRRSEAATEGTDPRGQERMSLATVSGDKATRDEAAAPSPERPQNQCDYRGCAKDYRSFRASDCTYQPPRGGPRKTCERGRRPAEAPQRAAQVQTPARAQQCNLVACARLYRSFDPADCTYQPGSGGARRTCDR
jgi:hypothetical protein